MISFASVGVLFATIKILQFFHSQKKRRSPFTSSFLRGPGQSLMEKLEDINEDLIFYLTLMFVMPLLFYSLFISELYFRQRPFTVGSVLLYIAPGIMVIVFTTYKMVRLFNRRRITRLGYEGEVATGQELNQMMLQGYHVFHDFVADRFNIDHIVVGPAGVFAVETKARAKPTSDNRSADAKATYDGKCIHFPKWREIKPLKQARNQAAWLERWLSSCVGEKTAVRPVVILPGWFVTRTASEGLPVINPKQFQNIAKPVGGKWLEPAQIQRIVHQIDQRCRNIESKDVNGLGGRN
jgi:hypothetical protein